MTRDLKEVRDRQVGASLDGLVLDFRYAWRALSNARALAAIIVLTLALGIGANTAIFSVVHAMLLEPLPYRGADRLLFVWLDRSDVGYPRGPLSWPDLKDLREGSRTCVSFGGIWATGTVALSGDGDPEQLRAALVTTNFFDVLGAQAAIGRTFRPEDGARGAAPAVLLGWDLFERRYGGDPSIVGRQIQVNDQSTTVIGVMPKAFRLLLPTDSSVPDRLQLWAPLFYDVETWPRGSLFLRVVARMRPGFTVAEARDDISSIADRIGREVGTRRAFTTVALQADDVREIRGPLLALFVGVGILLTIGCVNVAGLLIARGLTREGDSRARRARRKPRTPGSAVPDRRISVDAAWSAGRSARGVRGTARAHRFPPGDAQPSRILANRSARARVRARHLNRVGPPVLPCADDRAFQDRHEPNAVERRPIGAAAGAVSGADRAHRGADCVERRR